MPCKTQTSRLINFKFRDGSESQPALLGFWVKRFWVQRRIRFSSLGNYSAWQQVDDLVEELAAAEAVQYVSMHSPLQDLVTGLRLFRVSGLGVKSSGLRLSGFLRSHQFITTSCQLRGNRSTGEDMHNQQKLASLATPKTAHLNSVGSCSN